MSLEAILPAIVLGAMALLFLLILRKGGGG
jgi:hypothetical protein